MDKNYVEQLELNSPQPKPRRKLPYLLLFPLIVLLLLGAAIGGYFGYRADSSAERLSSDLGALEGLLIVGQLTNLDLSAGVATLTWYLRAVGNYSDGYFGNYGYPTTYIK